MKSKSGSISSILPGSKDETIEDADSLPEPQDLAGEAITELEAVVDDLKEVLQLIETNGDES
ncbi:MAG: hypothetical protein NG747_02785 [Candidatus Brocadia sp.]|nr:hypothetical protein [Candidatus Brocadia sp.]